jgi:hypothetical protein
VSTFGRLVIQAAEDPDSADRNTLLTAADEFLNACPPDDSPARSLARTMAYRAMDWCVWPETYPELVRAVERFSMSIEIKTAIEAN